ncbi:hypothetical protein CL628_03620 [bacterium]|nr:hypothetical protein [bacterium]|tara:strand:+ start:90 stop:626 length:537 start_codon:yes stop_codon:yes gene_type:complete
MTRDWKAPRYTRRHAFYGLLIVATALIILSIASLLSGLAIAATSIRMSGDLLLASVCCLIVAGVGLGMAARINVLARHYNTIATTISLYTMRLRTYSVRLTTFKVGRMVGTLALLLAIAGFFDALIASATNANPVRGFAICILSLAVAGIAMAIASAMHWTRNHTAQMSRQCVDLTAT